MNKITSSIEANTLITEYSVLVKKIAKHLKLSLPDNIQEEDLVQIGMIGLLEASQKYDADKGASFKTYAGIRIRGSMLDELRKTDWTPRSVYQNLRKINKSIKEVENKYQRQAQDHEVADVLNISLAEYYKMKQESHTKIFGFEDLGITDDGLKTTSEYTSTPTKSLDKVYLKKNITRAMAKLNKKERLVLTLYYQEELNLKEIGEILSVSESRISQIHSQALSKLHSQMPET